MAASKQSKQGPIYQIKITLRDSKPPIWRRLQVAADTSLEKLHIVLQIAFGWTNSHLHQFIIDGQYYSMPEFGLGEHGHEVLNEKRVKLGRLGLEPKRKFYYEYDFGDSWEHEIVVEKLLETEAGVKYPRCTGGKRACPPEDCGGIGGYERLLEVISDPSDPEHESMKEWLGGPFDAEHFDTEEVNEELSAIR
jgi:hypothetical protein